MAGQKAYRLNANKSKFYALAKRYYPEIVPMKQTQFIKHYRRRDYTLEFRSGSYYHSLFLSVCAGDVLLGDDWCTYDDDGECTSHWECHNLTLKELLELGLLEEVAA